MLAYKVTVEKYCNEIRAVGGGGVMGEGDMNEKAILPLPILWDMTYKPFTFH